MGRTTPSNLIISPSQRRDARAKRAKQTVSKDIPALLSAYPRARLGVEGAEVFGKVSLGTPELAGNTVAAGGDGDARRDGLGLEKGRGKGKDRRKSIGQKRRAANIDNNEESDRIHDSTQTVTSNSSCSTEVFASIHQIESIAPMTATSEHTQPTYSPTKRPRIRIRVADTLDAAHSLLAVLSASSKPKSQTHPQPHITILNMCSPLRPGGGFLTGATSQEESLCMRTTLYPSLREEFYRLPEVGGVYTSDVLVFRTSGSDGKIMDLPKGDRWWVDVVSAGMLRFPEVEDGEDGETRYVRAKDREMVEEKMRGIMRVVQAKSRGKKRAGRGLVLGAWGCGAYGNPVREVAECWRRVLIGDFDKEDGPKKMKSEKASQDFADLDRERESWSDIEIVFAIKERKMAAQFARYFGGDAEIEIDKDREDDEEASNENENSDIELQDKIAELTSQMATSRSEVQRGMLTKMLHKLKVSEGDDG